MVDLSKPRRVVDEDFLAFVRSRRCCVTRCTAADTDPHHLKSRGSGGSDHTAVSMCRQHHTEVHTLGLITFEKRHEMSLWNENALALGEYIERSGI